VTSTEIDLISSEVSQQSVGSDGAKLVSVTSTLELENSPVMQDLAGQLAPRSRVIYENDARHFASWLTELGLTLETATRSHLIQYRSHLAETYAKATAARMLSVARRLLGEAVKRGDLTNNPAADIKGFKVGDNETPHHALNDKEARKLLAVIDLTTKKGKRDYALILLLLWTGLRRSEAAALTLGDLKTEQGHHVLMVQHGKGDKRRKVKLPIKAMRAISDYLEATGRKGKPATAPLFVGFNKGDHPEEKPISDKLIYRLVLAYAKAAEIESLSPHGLRASFVTLALEGGAKLQQVQYAAGHADPRTTERYQKRKINLDDNAVDYLRF
jgi:site-specific recombinase XerD